MSKDFEHLGNPHAYGYTGFAELWKNKKGTLKKSKDKIK